MTKVHDRVLFALCCIGLAAVFFCGFLDRAPNRLATGTPLPLHEAPGLAATIVIIGLGLYMPISLLADDRLRSRATIAASLLLLFACLAAAGQLAALLADPGAPAMRLSLGPGFWIATGAACLALLEAVERARLGLSARMGLVGVVAAGFCLMASAGTFDNLSLAREFVAQRTLFFVELRRHLALVGAALLFASGLGSLIVVAILRNERLRGTLLAGLGIIQTIPSIALFGLAIAPLAALGAALPAARQLGIEGTGAAPAIIALTAYSLLPLVRGFYVGLSEVPAAVKEAAIGQGYDRRRLFREVELPLALPALVSAFRVVTIQAIGLATIAALIGAGGLGTFVFRGIGQYAIDLVLLGAIPVVLVALAADLLFRLVIGMLRR